MEEKIICIYHSRDLDGWASAAIVKKKYPGALLIGWDYGDDIPELEPGVKVIMVDVSFPIKDMVYVAGNSGWEFLWIDHHKSAIKEYDEYIHGGESFCQAWLDPKFAACELTWKAMGFSEPLPEMVRLLGRYDCFGHKGTEEEQRILMFQYAARAMATDVEEAEQFLIDRDSFYINQVIEDGEKIYKYLCVDARSKFEKLGFDVMIQNKVFKIINGDRINPKNFNIDLPEYNGAGCFWYRNGLWEVFVYALGDSDGSVIFKSLPQ